MLALTPEPTVASVFAPRTRIAPDGTVEGYASLFGEIDQARDMVMPGAFTASLKLRGVRRVPMLFQHDPAEPVGIWLELREDYRGLYVRGRLIPEVTRARELTALIEAGAADGLSIGFRTVKGRLDPKTRIRKLDQIDLWEISIVTFPLLAGARVRAVKGASPSRARTRAEREWSLVSVLAGEALAPTGERPRSASRIDTVHTRRQSPRRDRIRGWIHESARRDGAAVRRVFAP
jgi:HK97 family phage prohead protease